MITRKKLVVRMATENKNEKDGVIHLLFGFLFLFIAMIGIGSFVENVAGLMFIVTIINSLYCFFFRKIKWTDSELKSFANKTYLSHSAILKNTDGMRYRDVFVLENERSILKSYLGLC